MSKKLTPYQKEIQNLKRRIKTAEKAGYEFPEQMKLPRTSKQAHEMRGNKLYGKAIAYKSKHGEVYENPSTVREKRQIEKQESEYDDYRSEPEYVEDTNYQPIDTQLLEHIYQLLEIFDVNELSNSLNKKVDNKTIEESETQKQRMIALLDSTIQSQGIKAVCDRLNKTTTASEINEIVEEALNTYRKTEQQIENDFNRFAELITGGALTPQQAQSYSNNYGY